MTPTIIARAKEAIKLLDVLGTAIQPSLEAVLEKELPDLLQALEGTTMSSSLEGSPVRTFSRMSSPEISNPIDIKKAKVERFQGLVLNLLKEITAVSCTKEWLEGFASAQGKQLSIYSKFPCDKAFLSQCLGFTLSRITTDSFVRDHIVLIFRTMNHSNMIERRGCAQGVGECARHHTSLMLTELENIAKWEHSKKASGGLFGFIKEAYHRGSPDAQAIFLRATIVLSYGYLVVVSPTDFLPQRLDQTVLPFLRQYMNDVVVREAHLEAIHMIAQSVSRLTNDYRFDARYEMLSYIKVGVTEYVNQEDPEMLSNWIRLFACRATNSLVCLEPPLSDNELRDLATTLSKHILTICREKSGLKTIDNDESSTTMDSTVSEYRNAIAQMIKKKPIVDTVCTMLKRFGKVRFS
uniref:MROH2B-like HEAT-repeats domain-containing protein n=1 Tax=Panagrolaimus superbus TaxID=310955 RepID=A0A914Z6L9_9BILA